MTLLELMIAMLTQAIIMAMLYFYGPGMYTAILGVKKDRAANDSSMIYGGLWGTTEDYDAFVGDNGIAGILPTDASNYVPYDPRRDGANPPNATYTWIQDNLASPGQNSRPVSLLGITAGWNGPYVGLGLNQIALKNDPWGDSWMFDPNGPPVGGVGALTKGTVRSAGNDQILYTADDITSAPGLMALGQFGSVFITVVDAMGRPVDEDTRIQVQVTNPTPGAVSAVQWQFATWVPAQRHFTISGLWPGRHAIQVTGLNTGVCDGSYQANTPPAEPDHTDTCTGLYGHGIAYVRGGGAATVTIRVVNVVIPET